MKVCQIQSAKTFICARCFMLLMACAVRCSDRTLSVLLACAAIACGAYADHAGKSRCHMGL